MMFFLGLLVGTTAGFFCAAMAQAASADVEARENTGFDYVQLTRAPSAAQRAEIQAGEAANTGYHVRKRTGS